MVDVDTPKKTPEKDPARKAAALWATVVAVPVTLIVGAVAFFTIMPDNTDKTEKAAAPVPSTPVVMEAPRLD
jgi:flagellar basal body-associated protein FliL